MDRTEQTGLATAIVIHALFALLLWFGMQTAREPVPEKESISVSLVGEIAPVSSAPDPVQEAPDSAPAPAAEELVTPLEAAPGPPAPRPLLQPAPVVPPKAIPKITPKVTPKAPPKVVPKAVKQPAPARIPPKTPPKTAARSGGFGKGFEDRIAGIGAPSNRSGAGSSAGTSPSAGAGKAAGTPAAKSGAEVRRSVTTVLAGQIRPFLQACAPSGVDVDKISTFITINLASNGSVTGVSFDKQTGVNDSNSPQADPLKQCAVRAAKQASPYRGLDPAYHDLWKSHRMQLRAR
jgi:hypothetical protein